MQTVKRKLFTQGTEITTLQVLFTAGTDYYNKTNKYTKDERALALGALMYNGAYVRAYLWQKVARGTKYAQGTKFCKFCSTCRMCACLFDWLCVWFHCSREIHAANNVYVRTLWSTSFHNNCIVRHPPSTTFFPTLHTI